MTVPTGSIYESVEIKNNTAKHEIIFAHTCLHIFLFVKRKTWKKTHLAINIVYLQVGHWGRRGKRERKLTFLQLFIMDTQIFMKVNISVPP